MPFKMKSGSPMKRNFNAGSSPAKHKMEYGPYSYSHNTKKATKEHSGDPHGAAPAENTEKKAK